MYPKKEKGYEKRIAISKYNKDRLRGEAKEIRLRYHPDEKHRNMTDNELIGHILDHYCDKETL